MKEGKIFFILNKQKKPLPKHNFFKMKINKGWEKCLWYHPFICSLCSFQQVFLL